MKNIVVLIPGLFDQPLEALKGQTPVEKAQVQALDEIAQKGQWIRVQPPKGGLEHALLELFGLESGKTHLSVSSLEIYQQNLPFKPSESSFLFQMVSLFEGHVVDSDPHLLKKEELALLCSDLNQTFDSWAHFIPLGNSMGVCKIKEPYEHDAKDKEVSCLEGMAYADLQLSYFKKNKRQEHLDAIFAYLEQHPLNKVREDFEERVVNGVVFSQGGAPLNAIISKKFYERFCLFSAKSSSRGLAQLLEMKNYILKEEKSVEYFNTLIEQIALKLGDHQTFIIELHEVLESTLHGNLLEKIKRMEYLDRYLLVPLLQFCNELGIQLIVTPLKQTALNQKEWVEGAVPWILYNPKHRKSLEPILAFREREFDRIKGQFTIRSLASQFLY